MDRATSRVLGGSPRLITSSVVLTAGLLLSVGLGFVFHLVVARGLGPVGYGAFAASLTYVGLWAIVMGRGVNLLLIPACGPTEAASATVATEGTLLEIGLLGLGDLVRIIPLGPTLLTGAGTVVAVAGGWWTLPHRPLAQGLLAVVVSAIAWEAAAP